MTDEKSTIQPSNGCELFVECDTCRAKPGMPALCQGCLINRQNIEHLFKLINHQKQENQSVTNHNQHFLEDCLRTEAPVTPELLERLSKLPRLIHGILGKLTELGELADGIKKYIYYGNHLDLINLLEELGDGFWYDSLTIDALKHEVAPLSPTGSPTQCNWNQIQQKVIDKLRTRYPEAFTEHDATNRDLDAERRILESDNPD